MPKLSERSRSLLGNTNAATGAARESFLVIRCHAPDKSAWCQAANRADSKGQLNKSKRAKSVLAAWVIRTLNSAADKQNPPEVTAQRKAAEAKRDAAEPPKKPSGLSAI